MSDHATSNVIAFPVHRLSRRDRAMIGRWFIAAAPLGIRAVHVTDTRLPADPALAERVVIELSGGPGKTHFILLARRRDPAGWVSLLLRAEPDGSMMLDVDADTSGLVREARTLRGALNAVRAVLPDEDCQVLDYWTEVRRSAQGHV